MWWNLQCTGWRITKRNIHAAHIDIYIIKQDRQALLKAKYCPRVAAVSCTQKCTKSPCHVYPWLWYSIGFWRLSRYMSVHNFIKLSAVVHKLSCPQRKQILSKTILSSLWRTEFYFMDCWSFQKRLASIIAVKSGHSEHFPISGIRVL